LPQVKQFVSGSVVNQVLGKLINLMLQVFFCIIFKEPFGIFIDYGHSLETAGRAEFDVAAVAQQETSAPNVLYDGFAHQIGELGHIEVGGYKAGRLDGLYVMGEDFVPALGKLKYPGEQFRNVISYCR
jgi:hypothetical protein